MVESKGTGADQAKGELIVMNRTGSLVVQDQKGRDRERYPVVYGARLGPRGQAERRAAQLETYLVETRQLDPAKAPGERRAAVLILTAFSQRDLIEQARYAGALSYLVKPFERTELVPAVEVALGRFKELRALADQTASLEEQLETRKIVDRAKRKLMDEFGLNEGTAFSFIQRRAMSERVTMREISPRIIDGTVFDTADLTEEDSGRHGGMQLIMYKYEVSGVVYECSQDVSTLGDYLDIQTMRLDFPCSVRYNPHQPANSTARTQACETGNNGSGCDQGANARDGQCTDAGQNTQRAADGATHCGSRGSAFRRLGVLLMRKFPGAERVLQQH